MFSLNQRGAIQFIILLILLAGIAVGVYLITSGPLKIFPRASVSSPVTPQTSFILNDSEATKTKQVGSEFKIFIWARSDIEPANLFTAKLQYPPHLLEVVSIDKAGSFITSWVEEYFDNDTGIISLIGGVPAPGLSTVPNNTQFMASITFRAKNAGTAVVIFSDDSAIYSNANNIDILTVKEPLTLSLGGSTVPPSPTSAPTPTSSIAPSTTWNYQRDYSGIQGQNNLYYLAYIKSSGTYAQVSFDGTNWRYTGPGSDRNFLIENNKTAPSYPSHAVIRWVSPRFGTVSINGYFQRCCTEVGDFNNHPLTFYSVRKNTSQVLWDQSTEGTTKYPYSLTNTVSEGDNIEFWVDANYDSGWDGTYIDFTISYSTTPITQPQASGDGNRDGIVNLADLSILLSNFNKTSGFPEPIDLNGDGRVNSIDYGLMLQILIQAGVIKVGGVG